jgi:hypothetical protein
MAGSGRPIARSEGVSTLKPGGAPAEEVEGSSREPLVSRSTREQRAADRIAAASHTDEGTQRAAERADAPLQREQESLERRKEGLEEDVRDARERGDTKAVRTLQSQLSTTTNRLREVEQERDQWPAWIVQQAQAGKTPAQMIEAVRAEQVKKQATKALTSRSEPDEIIAGLIDSDDPDDLDFARFLRRRVKAEIPVTAKNLSFHREEFEEHRRLTAAPNGSAPAARKTPPKLAGAGGGDLGGEKTGWTPGMSTTDLLSKGFAEQDRARRH